MATPESQEKQAKWLQARIDYIKKLPDAEQSDIQKLLLILADSPGRTPEENRQFDALIRSEKAEERAETARIAARAIVTNKQDAERKARNHRLIERGGLSDLAGLQDMPNDEFLGAMLGVAKLWKDERQGERLAGWKSAGSALLAERVELKKGSRKKKGVSDPQPPAPDSDAVRQSSYG